MSETRVEGRDGEELVARLNMLVEELERYPDTKLREKVLGLGQLIPELYGESLRRIITAMESQLRRY